MGKIATSVSLDADVKEQAAVVLGDPGFDASTAVGMFLRQTIRERRIPSEFRCDVPNAETRSALEEIREMEKNPEKYKRYANFGELLKEVFADA